MDIIFGNNPSGNSDARLSHGLVRAGQQRVPRWQRLTLVAEFIGTRRRNPVKRGGQAFHGHGHAIRNLLLPSAIDRTAARRTVQITTTHPSKVDHGFAVVTRLIFFNFQQTAAPATITQPLPFILAECVQRQFPESLAYGCCLLCRGRTFHDCLRATAHLYGIEIDSRYASKGASSLSNRSRCQPLSSPGQRTAVASSAVFRRNRAISCFLRANNSSAMPVRCATWRTPRCKPRSRCRWADVNGWPSNPSTTS